MVSSKAEKYASSGLPWQQDHNAVYFPDAVIAPLVEAAEEIAPRTFAAHMASSIPLHHPFPTPEAKLSLAESRSLIVAALGAFDKDLGRRAQEIIRDEKRWKLAEVAPQDVKTMYSQPAGAPGNPTSKAFIGYDFDGTINGAIYMAHEIGHAIADDKQREAGTNYGENPRHMEETQAYFVQHIFAAALCRHADPKIAEAAKTHFNATMAHYLYNVPMSLDAKAAQQGIKTGAPTTSERWFGANLARHARAKDITATAQDVRAAQREGSMPEGLATRLHDQIESLHSRPAGLFSAYVLFRQAQGFDADSRRRVIDIVQGAEGPKGILEAMSAANLKTSADIKAATRDAVNAATAPIRETPALTAAVKPASVAAQRL